MSYTDRFVLLSALSLISSAAGCAELAEDETVDEGAQELSLPKPDPESRPAHQLVAWAALPHTERREGPTSGQFTTPANGVTPPYSDAQPIPGWSGLLSNGDGSYVALPDNGFGSKGNSGDYVLGFYVVRPNFKTRADGTSVPGSVTNRSFTAFNDRKGLLKNGKGVELTITADLTYYRSGGGAGADSTIPVDEEIKSKRLLTGFDFDVESIARGWDGTFWVGEEFGPYILHFGWDGTLLEEPIEHPYLKSPAHPAVLAGSAAVTSASSRGFESLAFDWLGRYLYAVPEAAPTVDSLRPVPGDERVLEIFQVDPLFRKYTGRTFKYQKDGPITGNNIVIGDMTSIGKDKYVLIERDSLYGAAAVVKRLYLIDLNVTRADGILEKRLLIDLLDIDDPRDIGGDLPGLAANKFNMPFDSIECVLSSGLNTLTVAIDTNFPTEDGRTPGQPDDTEIIQLRFQYPVASYAPGRWPF